MGKLHLWLGIGLAIYFLLMGITGSLLVFGREVDQLRERDIHQVAAVGKAVPLSRVLDGFHKVHPEQQVSYISYPRMPTETYSIRESGNTWTQRYTYINPYSGDVAGERTRGGTFYGFLCFIHFYLGIGQLGWTLNGYGAILMSVVLMSGLLIWWPTKLGQWKTRLGLRRDRGTRVLVHDTHNVTGFYPLLLMLMFTATALVFAFKQPMETFVYTLTGVTKDAPVEPTSTGTHLPIDTLVTIADSAIDGRIQRVNFPQKSGKPLVVRKEWDNWNQTRDRVEISLDPVTGKILKIDDSRTWPLGKKVIQLAIPLHFGLIGGLPTRILWVLLGLVPVILTVTGFLQWWYKKTTPRKPKRTSATGRPARKGG